MYHISLLEEGSFTNTQPVETTNINGLAHTISQRDWAPALFKDNYRNLENCISTQFIVLDIDANRTLEEAKVDFADYWHIIATSRNHQKEKDGKPACDRFRVVLLLDDTVTDTEVYTATYKALQSQFPFIDGSTCDMSRFFYRSPEVISVNDDLLGTIPIAEATAAKEPERQQSLDSLLTPGLSHTKGTLLKNTLQFLMFGSDENRNLEVMRAGIDMMEQGYEFEEALQLIEDSGTRNSYPTLSPLSKKHLRTLENAYKRTPTNELRLEDDGIPDEIDGVSTVPVQIPELLKGSVDYLRDKDRVKGDPTHVEGLDKLLGGGFREGEITVLHAEAKTGKNTLWHWLQYIQLMNGTKMGYASRELDPQTEVVPNYMAIHIKKNVWKKDVTDLEVQDFEKIVTPWGLHFAEGYGYFPWDAAAAWMTRLIKIGVKSFWFDHLNYMLEEDDHKKASKFMRNLKTFAKEQKIHVNMIIQPTQIIEGRSLGLNTLKGGSGLGQTLDNLFTFKRVEGQKDITELDLKFARHKIARPGKIYFKYDQDSCRFTEAEAREVEQAPQGSCHTPFDRYNNRTQVQGPITIPKPII